MLRLILFVWLLCGSCLLGQGAVYVVDLFHVSPGVEAIAGKSRAWTVDPLVEYGELDSDGFKSAMIVVKNLSGAWMEFRRGREASLGVGWCHSHAKPDWDGSLAPGDSISLKLNIDPKIFRQNNEAVLGIRTNLGIISFAVRCSLYVDDPAPLFVGTVVLVQAVSGVVVSGDSEFVLPGVDIVRWWLDVPWASVGLVSVLNESKSSRMVFSFVEGASVPSKNEGVAILTYERLGGIRGFVRVPWVKKDGGDEAGRSASGR